MMGINSIPLYGRTKLLAISFILLLPSVSANTQFAEDSCQIIGDADVYGIGIRLSYYLQFVALICSIWIDHNMATGIRYSTNILSIAIFINSIRSASLDNSLMIVEWYIVQYLTTYLWMFNIPATRKAFKSATGSICMFMVIWSATGVLTAWVYWKGTEFGAKEGCDAKLFLFKAFSAYAPQWITFSKVYSTFLGVCSIGPLVCAIWIPILKLKTWDKVEVHVNEKAERRLNPWIQFMMTMFLAVFGSVSIAWAEMTIVANQIEFPDVKLTDSGQFIPFLIGVFSLTAVLWDGLRKIINPRRYDEDRENKPFFKARSTEKPPPVPPRPTFPQRPGNTDDTVILGSSPRLPRQPRHPIREGAPSRSSSVKDFPTTESVEHTYETASAQELRPQRATSVELTRDNSLHSISPVSTNDHDAAVHNDSRVSVVDTEVDVPGKKITRRDTPYFSPELELDYVRWERSMRTR